MAPAAVAEEALHAAIDRPDASVSLKGTTGSGKTSTAIEIADLARGENRLPLLVRPPASALDAGPISVSVLLGALGAPLAPGKSLRYAEGLARLRQMLYERKDEIVVIADEPSAWVDEDSYFGPLGRSAREVFMADPRWPTIILDQSTPGKAHAVLDSMPSAADFEGWGSLRDAALVVGGLPEASVPKTPLNHKLLAAVVAWGRAVPQRSTSAVEVAETLREVLCERRTGPRLWGVWQKLALARTQLPDSVIGQLGGEKLDELSKDTLYHALLDGAGRLHDVPRSLVAREGLSSPISEKEKLDVHRLLFKHHLEAIREAEMPERIREHAAEALFHGGEAGEEDVGDLVPVTFVEQLNSLGRRLSRDHRDRQRAAAVFLTAIGIDEENDYAQHYRGFNLDFEGERAQEVEERYDAAVNLQPTNPKWHARRVTFLADIGKLKAAREAWSEARNEATGGLRSDQPDLYTWIAGALLHQGELTFADDVLSSVPTGTTDATIEDLRLALKARFSAQDEGTVVPAPRSWRAWWTEGPTQLAARDTQGRELARWSAGRVEVVDDEGVQLRVAVVAPGGGPPSLGRTAITPSRMEMSFLDDVPDDGLRVGQFVEVGEYEHPDQGRRIAIRLVRPDPHLQPSPPLMRLDRWRKSNATPQPAAV
jgi:tetratricopeptide (TPR) repeat protein